MIIEAALKPARRRTSGEMGLDRVKVTSFGQHTCTVEPHFLAYSAKGTHLRGVGRVSHSSSRLEMGTISRRLRRRLSGTVAIRVMAVRRARHLARGRRVGAHERRCGLLRARNAATRLARRPLRGVSRTQVWSGATNRGSGPLGVSFLGCSHDGSRSWVVIRMVEE